VLEKFTYDPSNRIKLIQHTSKRPDSGHPLPVPSS
jgi:hypothetical protein